MILIIDNYDSFTYNLYQFIAANTNEVKVIRNDKISLEQIKELGPAGIILSPGPGRPENAGVCVELVRALAKEIPILGVCLGHQAIAVAYGASVCHAKEIVHGKPSVIFHNRSRLYKDVPLPFAAGRYHSLLVDRETLPETLEIESESNDGVIMGLKHKTYSTYGVQFHPESILSTHGETVLLNFLGVCQES